MFSLPIDHNIVHKKTTIPRDAVVQVGRRLDVSPPDAGRQGCVCLHLTQCFTESEGHGRVNVELMLCDEVKSLCMGSMEIS